MTLINIKNKKKQLTLNLKFNDSCNLKLSLKANSKEYPNLKL